MKKKAKLAAARRFSAPPEASRVLALQAGTAVFGSRGLHAASMDDIARRAGFTKIVLYRQFGSKRDLFEAVVDAECERVIEYLFREYARALDLPLPEQIRVATRAFFEYAKKYPEGFRLLFLAGDPRDTVVEAKVKAALRRVFDRIADMLRRGLRQYGSPDGQVADVLATMTVGLVMVTIRRLREEPAWDEDAVLDLIADFQFAALVHLKREALA
ncbi:MAG: TetR/AcrR family transcriptional regulator, partial [Candidatus Binatia bacterium]